MKNCFSFICVTLLFITSVSSANAESNDKAFTTDASGNRSVEFKQFSDSRQSALIIAFDLRNTRNDSTVYYRSTGSFDSVPYSTLLREAAAGAGYRRYISDDTIKAFFDLVPKLTYRKEIYKSNSIETVNYAKGIELELMYGAEYLFNNRFGLEGKFGIRSSLTRLSGDNETEGYARYTGTWSTGILMNFYF